MCNIVFLYNYAVNILCIKSEDGYVFYCMSKQAVSYTDIGRHIVETIKMCNTYEEKSNKVHGRRKITAST